MDSAAKLITALASLLWPILIGGFLFHLRNEVKAALAQLPKMVGRMKSAKFAGIEFELEMLASSDSSEDLKGQITTNQINVASKLEVEAKDEGIGPFLSELDRLCLEYDHLRSTWIAGAARTHEQTRILVKMRGLASATSPRIETYKSSGSTGSRLAAVAMMQMKPKLGDIGWLLERFRTDVPFVFYHAALALANIANNPERRESAVAAAQKARQILLAFSGKPDRDSMIVLDSIVGPEEVSEQRRQPPKARK